jgi:hypothetical protein
MSTVISSSAPGLEAMDDAIDSPHMQYDRFRLGNPSITAPLPQRHPASDSD